MNPFWNEYAHAKMTFLKWANENAPGEIEEFGRAVMEQLPFIEEMDWRVSYPSFNDGDACVPFFYGLYWRTPWTDDEESRYEREALTHLKQESFDRDPARYEDITKLGLNPVEISTIIRPLYDFLSGFDDVLMHLWGDSHRGVWTRNPDNSISFEVDTSYWED
jgi:hypothetical protein